MVSDMHYRRTTGEWTVPLLRTLLRREEGTQGVLEYCVRTSFETDVQVLREDTRTKVALLQGML